MSQSAPHQDINCKNSSEFTWKKNLAIEPSISIFSRHPYVYFFFLFLIGVGSSFTMSFMVDSNRVEFFIFCLFTSTGMYVACITYRYAFEQFQEWCANNLRLISTNSECELDEWQRKNFSFFHSLKHMWICGFILAALSSLSYYTSSYLDQFPIYAIIFALILDFFCSFFAGVGLLAIFYTDLAIWNLANMPIVVHQHKYGISSIGKLLSKIYIVIGLSWFFYTFAAVVISPDRGPLSFLFDFPFILVAYPAFPLIFGSFVVCQWRLHTAMVRYKQQTVFELERRVREIEKKQIPQFMSELSEEVRFLRNDILRVSTLPEWPFGLSDLSRAFFSSMAGALPIALEFLITKYGAYFSALFVPG